MLIAEATTHGPGAESLTPAGYPVGGWRASGITRWHVES